MMSFTKLPQIFDQISSILQEDDDGENFDLRLDLSRRRIVIRERETTEETTTTSPSWHAHSSPDELIHSILMSSPDSLPPPPPLKRIRFNPQFEATPSMLSFPMPKLKPIPGLTVRSTKSSDRFATLAPTLRPTFPIRRRLITRSSKSRPGHVTHYNSVPEPSPIPLPTLRDFLEGASLKRSIEIEAIRFSEADQRPSGDDASATFLRPPLTLTSLSALAIINSRHLMLPEVEIVRFVLKNFPFYRCSWKTPGAGSQRAVRRALGGVDWFDKFDMRGGRVRPRLWFPKGECLSDVIEVVRADLTRHANSLRLSMPWFHLNPCIFAGVADRSMKDALPLFQAAFKEALGPRKSRSLDLRWWHDNLPWLPRIPEEQ